MAVKKATSATGKGAPVKKGAPAKKAPMKTSTAKKVVAPRASARKTALPTAKKALAPRASARKTVPPTAKKSAAKKTAAPRAGTQKAANTTRTTGTKATPTTNASARKAPVPRTATAPKTATGPATAVKASARPQRLRVRENEKPWTVRELATVRADLEADVVRLQREISVAELDLVDLMRDAGEGAGDDQADAGTATFEREQEISLANNAREVFEQSARALARLIDGTYGVCESCGAPIGKNRLLAFPRATLCMTCKSKQERR
jgi:RNA polymerase-binding transcription factor DksA